MSYKINYYDPENPQLEITIGERRIQFSLAGVDPRSRDWLGGVLDRMFHEEIERAVSNALYIHKKEMRKLLGIAP